MKLLSYKINGEAKYGVATDAGVVDLNARFGADYPTLKDAIAAGALAKLQDAAGETPDHQLTEIEFDLPIPNADKFLCAGRNYRAYHEVIHQGKLDYPNIFARLAHSFAPHGQEMLVPKVCERLDYEGELVAVIGTGGRHIAPEDAYDHVMGYTIMNEGSPRKWERAGTQNFATKNFDRCGGLGPWIVAADEVGDPTKLHITTRRNGEVVQDGGTDLMIYDIPAIIAHASSFLTLQPGDMIATGSPGGTIAGADDPKWLSAGEVLEVDIPGVGTLSNGIRDE